MMSWDWLKKIAKIKNRHDVLVGDACSKWKRGRLQYRILYSGPTVSRQVHPT